VQEKRNPHPIVSPQKKPHNKKPPNNNNKKKAPTPTPTQKKKEKKKNPPPKKKRKVFTRRKPANNYSFFYFREEEGTSGHMKERAPNLSTRRLSSMITPKKQMERPPKIFFSRGNEKFQKHDISPGGDASLTTKEGKRKGGKRRQNGVLFVKNASVADGGSRLGKRGILTCRQRPEEKPATGRKERDSRPHWGEGGTLSPSEE